MLCLTLVLAASLQVSRAEVPPDVVAGGPPLISYGMPVYPDAARRARMWGYAMVELQVASDGTPAVVAASGSKPLLVRSGTQAALQSRFVSADVEVRCAVIVYRFAITADEPDYSDQVVSLSSPHQIEVSVTRYPVTLTVIVDPAPQPCFALHEPGSVTFCERLLRLLPLN